MAVFKKFKPKWFRELGNTGFIITPSRKVAESKHYEVYQDIGIREDTYSVHRKFAGSHILPIASEVAKSPSLRKAKNIVKRKEKHRKDYKKNFMNYIENQQGSYG